MLLQGGMTDLGSVEPTLGAGSSRQQGLDALKEIQFCLQKARM